jgi:hypothetical protein
MTNIVAEERFYGDSVDLFIRGDYFQPDVSAVSPGDWIELDFPQRVVAKESIQGLQERGALPNDIVQFPAWFVSMDRFQRWRSDTEFPNRGSTGAKPGGGHCAVA